MSGRQDLLGGATLPVIRVTAWRPTLGHARLIGVASVSIGGLGELTNAVLVLCGGCRVQCQFQARPVYNRKTDTLDRNDAGEVHHEKLVVFTNPLAAQHFTTTVVTQLRAMGPSSERRRSDIEWVLGAAGGLLDIHVISPRARWRLAGTAYTDEERYLQRVCAAVANRTEPPARCATCGQPVLNAADATLWVVAPSIPQPHNFLHGTVCPGCAAAPNLRGRIVTALRDGLFPDLRVFDHRAPEALQ